MVKQTHYMLENIVASDSILYLFFQSLLFLSQIKVLLYVEQNVGLLLAILESRPEVARALHPPLMKLGLPSVLIDLLAFEMNKLLHERIPERYKLTSILVKLFVDNFNVTT